MSPRAYLHHLADNAVEQSHQLARRQLNLLFQLLHRLVLQANPQEESLEDGEAAAVTPGQALPIKTYCVP